MAERKTIHHEVWTGSKVNISSFEKYNSDKPKNYKKLKTFIFSFNDI